MNVTKRAIFLSILILSVTIFLLWVVKPHAIKKGAYKNKTEVAFTIETFKTETGGWGYNIVSGNKVFIKQDVIPAVQLAIPFRSEKEARRIAELVVKKLNSKKIPSITVEELDSLSITITPEEK
jgi:hypothetical protein